MGNSHAFQGWKEALQVEQTGTVLFSEGFGPKGFSFSILIIPAADSFLHARKMSEGANGWVLTAAIVIIKTSMDSLYRVSLAWWLKAWD